MSENDDLILTFLSLRHAATFPLPEARTAYYRVNWNDDTTRRYALSVMPIAARALGFCASDMAPWQYHRNYKSGTTNDAFLSEQMTDWRRRVYSMVYMHAYKGSPDISAANVAALNPFYTHTMDAMWGSDTLVQEEKWRSVQDAMPPREIDPNESYNDVYRRALGGIVDSFAFLLEKKYRVTNGDGSDNHVQILKSDADADADASTVRKGDPDGLVVYNYDASDGSQTHVVIFTRHVGDRRGQRRRPRAPRYTATYLSGRAGRSSARPRIDAAKAHLPGGASLPEDHKAHAIPEPPYSDEVYDARTLLEIVKGRKSGEPKITERVLVKYVDSLLGETRKFEDAMVACAMLRLADRIVVSRDVDKGWGYHGGVRTPSVASSDGPTELHVAQAICSAADALASGVDPEVRAPGSVGGAAVPVAERLSSGPDRDVDPKNYLRLGREYLHTIQRPVTVPRETWHKLPQIEYVFHIQMAGAHMGRIQRSTVVDIHNAMEARLGNAIEPIRMLFTPSQRAVDTIKGWNMVIQDRRIVQAIHTHLASHYRSLVMLATVFVDNVTMATKDTPDLLAHIHRLMTTSMSDDELMEDKRKDIINRLNGTARRESPDMSYETLRESMGFWKRAQEIRPTWHQENYPPVPGERGFVQMSAGRKRLLDPAYKMPRIHPYINLKLLAPREFDADKRSEPFESLWSIVAELFDNMASAEDHVYKDVSGWDVIKNALQSMPIYRSNSYDYGHFVWLHWLPEENGNDAARSDRPLYQSPQERADRHRRSATEFYNNIRADVDTEEGFREMVDKSLERFKVELPEDGVIFLREAFLWLHLTIADKQLEDEVLMDATSQVQLRRRALEEQGKGR